MSSIADLLWTPLHTTINTSSNPPLPHTCNTDQRRRGVPGLPEAEEEESIRPRQCHTSLSEILCWQAGPHLHKDLQQITGTVQSPFMLQTLHRHPHPKEIQNHRTKWLQACGSYVCSHEIIWKTGAGPPEGHHWTLAGSSSVCLRSKQVDDAVNMGLHYVLPHLDRPGAYVRILFVDFSSAFNTIIPNHLLPKLTQLSVPTSICQWINSFMTDRQQLERLGIYSSSIH